MKIKNRKTGGLANIDELLVHTDAGWHDYYSLAELVEDWCDYEGPSKTIWQIKDSGELEDFEEDDFSDGYIESSKSIGNYFESREEAEKAVEKLRALKRLKDKGFEFINFPYKKICKYDVRTGVGNLEYQVKYYEDLESDLDILFSQEDG